MSFVGQVAHVFKKDLRRFWPYLLALLGLTGVHMVAGLPWLSELTRYQLRLPAGTGVVTLGFIALSAAVVLQDAASGDLAFWPTRPVRAGAVALSKLLFLGIFVVLLPSLAHVRWIQSHTIATGTLGLLSDTLVAHGAAVFAVAGVAAISRSMKEFVAVFICAWIGYSVVSSLVAVEPDVIDRGLIVSRHYLSLWLILLTGLAAMLHQYGTRRTLRTVVGGSAVLAIGALAVSRASLDLSTEAERPSYVYGEPIELVEPALWLQRLQLQPGDLMTLGEDAAWASADVTLRTEQDLVFRLVESTSTVTVGPDVHRFVWDPEASERGPQYEPRGLRSIDGLAQVGNSATLPFDSNVSTLVAHAPKEEFASTFSDGAELDLRLELEAMRGTVLRTLPLTVGATTSVGGSVFEILAVRRSPGTMEVEVSRRTAIRLRSSGRWAPWDGPTILLANRERAEYLGMGRGSGGDQRLAPLINGARLDERTEVHHFPLAMFTGRMEDPPDDSWFDDVELILAGMEIVGEATIEVSRTIERWPGVGGIQEVDGRPPRRVRGPASSGR